MTQDVSEQISRVQSFARSRLARYANLDAAQCKQVFLFRKDLFCGIQISLGEYDAKWLIDQTCITFTRGKTVLENCPLEISPPARAA